MKWMQMLTRIVATTVPGRASHATAGDNARCSAAVAAARTPLTAASRLL